MAPPRVKVPDILAPADDIKEAPGVAGVCPKVSGDEKVAIAIVVAQVEVEGAALLNGRQVKNDLEIAHLDTCGRQCLVFKMHIVSLSFLVILPDISNVSIELSSLGALQANAHDWCPLTKIELVNKFVHSNGELFSFLIFVSSFEVMGSSHWSNDASGTFALVANKTMAKNVIIGIGSSFIQHFHTAYSQALDTIFELQGERISWSKKAPVFDKLSRHVPLNFDLMAL